MSIRSRLARATQEFFRREERSAGFNTAGAGLPALFRPQESQDAFGDNAYLYGAVSRISQEIARTKFHLHRVKANGDKEIVQNHQALEALKRPQPTATGKSMLSAMDLKLITGYHLCLNGEAFWLMDKRMRIGGGPTFLDILLPQYMTEEIRNGEVVEYIYRTTQSEVRFNPADIVHFKLPSPQYWQRGHSPVKSIRYALDSHLEADILNLSRIQNGAVPGGTLETDQPVPDGERNKILQAWKQRFGGAKNANSTAMLPRGLHFNKTQESNADMQYVEGKQTNRDEILANYGVGIDLLGKTESKTRANAEASIFVFMRFGALFFIEKFADTLTNDFLPAYPGSRELEFGFDDPVPENMEEKRSNAETLFNLGAATPNELRQQFGLEPLKVDGMDVPYLDMGKVPVGQDPVAA